LSEPAVAPRDEARETFAALGGWPGVLGRLVAGETLTAEDAEAVMNQVLDGAATPVQIAGLLVGLGAKTPSIEEMTGFVRAMSSHGEAVTLDHDVLDMVGTGGDRLRSINVTTLGAFIAAGAGVAVCKHGGRAASSSVGTADVLEALGVAVALGPEGVARCVREVGMGFCLAPRFHPAMRYAAPVRAELGIPTVMNFLGPLVNPARAAWSLVGVSAPTMAEKMAGVLGANGIRRAMVLFADDGLDELSVTSPSTVIDVTGDGDGAFELRRWRLDPRDLGLPTATMDDLRGGDAAFNAKVIRSVLEGERGPRLDIGVLNAAAGLVVAGRATDLEAGLVLASEAVDDGRASGVLDRLVEVSQAAAAEERSVS
jgi:anthranilate phosphoribosyltransferase